MAIEVMDPEGLDDAIRAYEAGQPLGKAAASVGVGYKPFMRMLRERGVRIRGTADRRIATPPGLAEDFDAGASVKSLARRHGQSRTSIRRMLDDLGCGQRGLSAAMILRWEQADPAARAAMVEAAHASLRGITRPASQAVARAVTNAGRTKSPLETSLGAAIAGLGVSVAYGVPVGRYNVDIVAGTAVAVEVFGGAWHASGRHRARFPERSRYILDAGYHLVIIWADSNGNRPGVLCAQHVAALAQIPGGDPSGRRQHWVIRGDGCLLASREDDGDEVPFVMPGGGRAGSRS